MGVRRSQHVAERRAGKHHVGDITAAAFDEPRVFKTRNRLTDGKFTHCILAFRPPPIGGGNAALGPNDIKLPGGRPGIGEAARSYIVLRSPSIGGESALGC